MSPREALREGARILQAAPGGSETAFLDASLLLAALLGLSREALFAAPELPLPEALLARYRELLALRAGGRPLAYLLGRKEFYGRDFLVDERVLIPRPDTELLVETALALGDGLLADPRRPAGPLRVHECCAGSGAVAVSIAAERPAWELSASDISEGALDIAARNARRLLSAERPGGSLGFYRGDLLAAPEPPAELAAALPPALPPVLAAGGGFDLLLANPPYIPSAEAKPLAACWGEPLLALDGGEDGLELCRRLLPEAASALAPGGWLLVEADPSQAAALRALFSATSFEAARSLLDLAGLERVTIGRKPWTS